MVSALSLGLEIKNRKSSGLSGLPIASLEWGEAEMNGNAYLKYSILIGVIISLLGLFFGLISKNDLIANASFVSLMFIGVVMWFDILFQVVFC